VSDPVKLAMIGFGELGRQILALISAEEQPDQVYYFDDLEFAQDNEQALPFSAYSDDRFRMFDFYVCLGYKHLSDKAHIINRLLVLHRHLPAYVAPSTYVSPSASVGQGTILYPMCNVDKGVRIGDGVIINNSVTISHDSVVENCCYLSPGVTIAGFVNIGEQTFIGSGAIVGNNVTIGNNAIIGIGTVVTRDVPSGASVIGNPMKLLKKPLRII
jgi:sugar O-acyltransferase (sialic acid O-acetyltransferase NeuD family)